ncbi:MAG: DUF1343 domain-containing protein [Bacteroidales bacterium]|jgi:uncharacterized protein YbbC (DUF1343 family)|nr:DUF1343 domain-containing protein [Bacteroidales bacterium]WRQ32486.1 DUF1343 domain-containing protein [Bacteroidales bacterium MB20-C3-3]MBP6454221.1 DUF1343 domain-containing protein [Bacteroidales bacterium]MBP8677785.1 DUF1343 domain-containing protein [Bacteroidales bacterium]MBP9583821.1 DUF1343 domain-containing protein [Bacteroidales bacterium]
MKKVFLTGLTLFLATLLIAGNIKTGAESISEYLPLLKGKKVAVLTNQTGIIGKSHLVDSLVSLKVNIVAILSPEHGFRGDADAGEHVASSIDEKTGIPIKSLYEGNTGKPSADLMKTIDVMVFDLQDVGVRFYTYLTTMARMMEACAESGVKMIVLDRPNPIGFYVDGPILDMKYKSGVGWLPIPTVHGMTLGELAGMINGEKWLKDGIQCDVTVIKCKNYTHASMYQLPVKPSPNLPDMRSIYLYPSTCYFEATPVSLGRGTTEAFQMYGHPNMKGYKFSFTPKSIPGAKFPPQLNRECYGVDLRTTPSIEEINKAGINLEYVIDAYNNLNLDDHFFRSFFELLIGQGYVRKMIKEGKSAAEIKAMWAGDVAKFKEQRRPYLLYPEN